MPFSLQRACPVVAHDRRSCSRSTQNWPADDKDFHADDFTLVASPPNLRDAIRVGAQPVAVKRRAADPGMTRIAPPRHRLTGAVHPLILRITNSQRFGITLFNGFRSALLANRAQFFRDVAAPYQVRRNN